MLGAWYNFLILSNFVSFLSLRILIKIQPQKTVQQFWYIFNTVYGVLSGLTT